VLETPSLDLASRRGFRSGGIILFRHPRESGIQEVSTAVLVTLDAAFAGMLSYVEAESA
jgi:hypothetical protein